MKSNHKKNSHSGRKVSTVDNSKLVIRVKKISGQVNGIQKMIEENRYCIDVLTQINAAKSALESLGLKIFEHHTNSCLVDKIKSGQEKEAISELLYIVNGFIK